MTQHDAYKRRAQVIKAMGHPSRLLMIHALAEGEKCVCELQQLVGSDMSTVSKHLSVLRNAGIVSDRKQGLWVHYSLRTPCLMRFLDCLDGVLHEPCECEQCAALEAQEVPVTCDCQ